MQNYETESVCRTRLNASLVILFLACVGMSTTRVENHRLEGFVFNQYHVKHIGECGMKCFAKKDCRSFNFNSSSLICELNHSAQRLGSEKLKRAPGVSYFYRND